MTSDGSAPVSAARAIGERQSSVVWSADADGSVDFVDAAWTALTGRPVSDALGGRRMDLVHPEDRAEALAAWRAAVASGGSYEREVRVLGHDGTYRRLLERAVPQRDARGTIVVWHGTTVDVNARRRADVARDLFAALAENSSDFVAIAEPDGRVLFVNDAGRRLVAIASTGDLAPSSLFEVFAPEERARLDGEIRPALSAAGSWRGETRFRSDDSRPGGVPVEAHFFYIRDERDRVTALATVTVDRSDRERMERRLQTLVEASVTLTASLDPQTTIEAAVRFVAGRFASYALLDVIDEAGVARRVAVAHGDPDRTGLVEALRAFDPPRERVATHPVARAIAFGEPSLERIDAAWIDRAAIAPAHAAAMHALDIRMLLVVPVVGAANTIGALTCALDARAPRGPFDGADVEFAVELGRRVGIAIENARLFARERRIAETLQAASLPASLPAIAGLRLDAAYRPGNSEATIGGDWYDAFVLDDGRVALTVGDVVGNGLHAAVTMARLRQAMQAAAFVRPDPALMLDVADRTLRVEAENAFATALAAIYDPATRTLEFATAGHPAPLLVHPAGDPETPRVVEALVQAGDMLGIRERGGGATKLVAVPLGTSIVFFTDGLLEITRDYDEGERRLAEVVARPGLLDGARPAETIVEAILGGAAARDDVAVLTASVEAIPGNTPVAGPSGRALLHAEGRVGRTKESGRRW